MSKEEKKAIENLRKNKGVSFAEADIILNLIEKLQKEIEELKEKNASLQKEIKLMKSININDNYISKKKIREKINKYLEYDKKVKTYTYDGRENFTFEWYKARALEELLEE
jgi:FtsZ-binding cell division protein ZapB